MTKKAAASAKKTKGTKAKKKAAPKKQTVSAKKTKEKKIKEKKTKEKKTKEKKTKAKKTKKNKDFEKLVKKGKKEGFLTYEEINKVLPDDMLKPDQIDETLMMFSEMNIKVEEDQVKDKNIIKDKQLPENGDLATISVSETLLLLRVTV